MRRNWMVAVVFLLGLLSCAGTALALYAPAGRQLVEERRDPVEWNADTYTYYHGDGLDHVVATRLNGSPWLWHAADDQGSAVTLTGTGGTVLERITYDDFGEPHIHDAAGAEQWGSYNRILYTGQWRDPLSGLYNYRTRWMHPALGRFLTRDTIGLWGDPANLGNGTAYVGNAPWNWVDPWGEKLDNYPFYYDYPSDWPDHLRDWTGAVYGDWGDYFGSKLGGSADRKQQLDDLGMGGRDSSCRGREIGNETGKLLYDSGAVLIKTEVGLALLNTAWSFEGRWTLGPHKTAGKWTRQMRDRGWTEQQITEAIRSGKSFPEHNFLNPANGAIRYVHPATGRSVVIDPITREVIHIGGDGFLY